jgi:hypothetical protein
VRDAAERAGAAAVTAEQFLAALDAPSDAEPDDAAAPARGGNPRRPSRAERAAQRVLRRLRPR